MGRCIVYPLVTTTNLFHTLFQALFPAPNDQSQYSWTVCELDLCNAHAGHLVFA
jgi:hypothetical protein